MIVRTRSAESEPTSLLPTALVLGAGIVAMSLVCLLLVYAVIGG